MCNGYHHCNGCGDTSPCDSPVGGSHETCDMPDVVLCEMHKDMTPEQEQIRILEEQMTIPESLEDSMTKDVYD